MLCGTLVTADALHTHAPVARAIHRCGGDYLLVIKANQPTPYKDTALLFSQPPNRLLPNRAPKALTTDTSAELNDQYRTLA